MPKGFTVIETLVTVSVISILAVLSVSVFSNVPKNNRDQKRMRDLQAMKQALELYRADSRTTNYSYPQTPTDIEGQNNLFINELKMSEAPADPLGSSAQIYRYLASPASCTIVNKDCTSFVVCARKEGNNSFNSPTACDSLNCKTWTTGCDANSCCGMGLSSD